MKVKHLLRSMSKAGWRIEHRRNHHMAFCPCGQHIVTMSVSASDHRAINNMLADIRGTGCQHQPKEATR